MVINITDKQGNTLINENDIKYKREHSYSYGIPLEYFLGTSLEQDIDVNQEYMITFNDREPSLFYLYGVKKEAIAGYDFFIMRFVKKVVADIMANLLPNNIEVFSIEFDKYVFSKNNQLNFTIFELRKKSLCLVNDANSNPTQKHIRELLAKPQTIKDGSIILVRTLSDYQLRFQNYYTITDTRSIVTTKNGKNLHNYLPFESKEAINGLDNYLVPSCELTTNLTDFRIGDVLNLSDDDKVVIIEKDEIAIFGTVSTYLVGAKESSKL